MKVALYCGCKPASNLKSDGQMTLLRQYANRSGWQIVIEVDEAGPSFATRRQRSLIMNAMRQGRIDAIVTTNVLCWARSIHDLTRSLAEILAYQIEFRAVVDAVVISGSNGLAMIRLLSIVQECERTIHGTKVKAGMAQAKLGGAVFGRPKIAEERKRNIRRLRQAGMSIKDIATRFKLSKASVYRLLAD